MLQNWHCRPFGAIPCDQPNRPLLCLAQLPGDASNALDADEEHGKKFRGYYHFVKRQQKHKDAFGVHPIRAVLVETTSETHARKLMELAQHPAVVGASNRSGLYWFTIFPLFVEPAASKSANRALPSYLDRPAIVLNPIWVLPDQSLHALGDAESSARA